MFIRCYNGSIFARCCCMQRAAIVSKNAARVELCVRRIFSVMSSTYYGCGYKDEKFSIQRFDLAVGCRRED